MFTKTLNKFKNLPGPTKSLLYLGVIYNFTSLISMIFINVFVFIQTKTLMSLVFYNAVFFTGIFLGFVIWGYIIAQLQISFRFNHLRAFILDFLSFVFLLFFHDTFTSLLIFAAINGIGIGVFWVGMHTFEVIYTDNEKNRDFYTSMVQVGDQLIGILAPLVATITFVLSEFVFHIDTFQLLFIILPFVYLLGIPHLFKLPDYIPQKISWPEIKYLLWEKKFRRLRNYYWAFSIPWPVKLTIIPIIAFISLNTVTNIGILETVLGVISIVVVIILSHFRSPKNRVNILFHMSILSAFAFGLLFFFETSFYFYIIYSLSHVFIRPIWRASTHSIDLHSIESFTQKNVSWYGGLLYRDLIFWIGRLAVVFAILSAALIAQNDFIGVKFGVIIFSVAVILIWFTAKRLKISG